MLFTPTSENNESFCINRFCLASNTAVTSFFVAKGWKNSSVRCIQQHGVRMIYSIPILQHFQQALDSEYKPTHSRLKGVCVHK